MELTYVRAEIANPAKPRARQKLQFLVDSGALYSLVPRTTLMELGIRVVGKRSFTLANGEVVEREIGNALFFYGAQEAASPVIFGEEGDSLLLGTVTLESLGFILDPFRRELRPLPMILG
jgi:predicted aspartyl protease